MFIGIENFKFLFHKALLSLAIERQSPRLKQKSPAGKPPGRTKLTHQQTYNQYSHTRVLHTSYSNATAEGLNSKIQMVKQMACGFRNREHYRTAIYFHCGGLDLYPR